MWKDLSVQQRADLMDIYLSHGISSLDEMRNHYDSRNQFAKGGNLFSGEDGPTQQMNSGLNLYRRTNNLGETEYIYQETPDSEEILLTPTNKRFSNDPTNWDYKDASGREYSPRMVSPSNSSTLEASEKMGPLEKYVAELSWRAKNDPASIALKGKYTMPAIAAPLLAPLGEAFAGTTIASIPATTWANTAMAAGFAGHGLNHTINEGIDGWGDAAMTALELAPLGQLTKPMWNAGKTALANQIEKVITPKELRATKELRANDPFFAEHLPKLEIEHEPFITSLQQGMEGLSTSEKLKWLWNKGKLVQRKIPIDKEHFYRGVRTKDALNDAIDNGVIRQGRHEPPLITFKGPFFGPGYISHEKYGNYVFEGNPEHIQWIKPWPYHNNGEVIPWHPGVGSAFPYYEGSTTVPTTGFSYWKKYPFIGWRSRSFDSLPKKATKALGGNLFDGLSKL